MQPLPLRLLSKPSLKKRCTAKPAPKPGLEHILLEPIAPSIGTVVHGVDLASLSEEEVAYIRQVWLERKVRSQA